MMNAQSYADLEIRILERQDAGYPVEITLNGDQHFLRGFLAADVLPWTASGNAQADGKRLFVALLGDGPAREAWARTRGQYPQRRVRLHLDTTAPELHALPWELLHDGQTFLAAHTATPLSRYLPLDTPSGALVSERPIRVLAALSNPTDLVAHNLAPLDIPTEHARLDALWRTLPVTPVFLEPPVTPERLEVALREHRPHILHLMAHGAFSQRRSQAVLYLQDDAGNTCFIQDVDFTNIFDRLGQESRPRLVFLATCESAMRSTVDAFAGLAPKLVQAGVPAVVAMQDKVAVEATHKLTATFYTDLFRHGEVDRALNAARSLLLTGQSPDASAPVLLMRLKDGKLWETAQATATARRDFYTHAPRLEAERYVNRPHEYAQIKTLLLADPATEGLTTALCGAGGFGKTTLARVLCDDAEVQARFADGILWATLGENPDVLARLREWVTVLGGIISENAPTIPQLINQLTDLLRDGAYLLLIDDVWDSAALTPFLCGGPRCAHLVTTRNRATLPAGVQPVAVDTMRAAEAVALLGYGVAADAPEIAALQTLAQQLGHWPLLLGIINGVLREICAQEAFLADALEYVAEGLTEEGLTVFDAADATDRARAVCTTMEVSLRRISDAERARYIELVIFPEDLDIPATAAAQLWGQTGGLSAFKTKDLFRRLANASLVQAYNAGRHTIRLHDIVRVYLTETLGAEGRAAAHRALLAAYHNTQTGEGWHTAPDDGYLYAHLVYHLDALAATDADAAAELASLFATDAWLQVRVAADDYTYDGYLADLEYAWRRAEAQVKGGDADTLAECMRYALIRTTVNSLAGSYSPELVAHAVEIGLWSPARALSVAARMPYLTQRAKTYTLLLKLDVLTDAQRKAVQRDGLAAARAIWTVRERAQALAALAPQLTGAAQEQALMEGLAVARVIRDEDARVQALAALAPQLTGTAREQALAEGLALARAIRDEGKRVQALAALAPQLTGAAREQVLVEGLAAARVIKNNVREWVKALTVLAPQLTNEDRERALAEGLAAVRTIVDKWDRAEVLMTLAPQLTGKDQEQVLTEGLAVARTIEGESIRAVVLMELAPQLTGTLLVEGLAAARTIEQADWRAEALAALAPQLTGAMQGQVLAEGLAAWAIADELPRAQVLVALAPQLMGEHRERVLVEGVAATRTIRNEYWRVKVLVSLALHFTGDARTTALAECLAMAREIEGTASKTEALVALVPQLTGSLLVEGLVAVQAITDEYQRAKALAALASQLTGAARKQALAEGMAATRVILDRSLRVDALAALAPQLMGIAREQVLEEGLATAWAIADEQRRAKALAVLASQLTGEDRERALMEGLMATQTIENEGSRAQVLVALAPLLTGSAREQALIEGIATARAMRIDVARAGVLAALAPQLTGDLLAEGLAVARAIGTERDRARALAALAPQLTGALLAEGLVAARGITDERWRAAVLAALLPCFTGTAAQAVKREYQTAIVASLNTAEKSTRAAMLYLLADKDAFKPDALGLTPAAVARIAEAVVDVCRRWEWV